MTDPTVEAYERFHPIDEIVANSRDWAEVDRATRERDSAAIDLAGAIPTTAAGLRIHREMLDRYGACAMEASDGYVEMPSCLFDLLIRHTRSLAAGALQLRSAG